MTEAELDFILKQGEGQFIEVYKNKLVVFNPEGLVKWMNPADFDKVSKIRNPIIASLLSRTIYVEKMGTGIKRMSTAMAEAGFTEPVFEQSAHSFFITFKDKNMDGELSGTSEKTSVKIITLLKNTPTLTIKNLADKIGVTARSIERNIKNIQEQGLLRRKGSDKGGHWEVL